MNSPHAIDLRSDTVTKPSEAMRQAIANADVGDDVLGDDPTVIRLEERVASMLGKERALFVPSGTMANLIAIRSHTEPGDEIIGHMDSHFYCYEGGGFAVLSGCSSKLLSGPKGMFDADDVRGAIRADNPHYPRSRLVMIENTQNRGGGAVWPLETIRSIREVADESGLRMHMDGARLMNACVASGLAASEYASLVDTVCICFSKGLGAPVGSALAGPADVMAKAYRIRKMVGGGMRQSGMLAAAALYALDHNVERLAEDHANARRLAEAIAEVDGLETDPDDCETNIVYFDVSPSLGTADELVAKLNESGVLVLPTGPQRIRAVTNLMVTAEMIDRTIDSMRKLGRG